MKSTHSRAVLFLAVAFTLSLGTTRAQAGIVKTFRNIAQNIRAERKASAGRREIKALVKPSALTTLGINDRRQMVRTSYAKAQQSFGVEQRKAALADQRSRTRIFLGGALLTLGTWPGIGFSLLGIDSSAKSANKAEALNEAKDRSLISATIAAKRAGFEISGNAKTFVDRSLAQQDYASAGHASWAGRVLSKMAHIDPKRGLGSSLMYHFYKAWGKGDAGRFLQKRGADKAYFAAVREAMK